MFYNDIAMGAISYDSKYIDMICEHRKDGTIVPIKFRVTDDDGLLQEYKVRSYRDLSHKGSFEMPNGVIATSNIFPFECKIDCFGREKILILYYNCNEHVWTLASVNR